MTGPQAARRKTYRHGALKPALIEAGLRLARAGGGPDAIVLREAARQAGVAPNAAYTYFADRHALVTAVASAVLAQLATVMAAEQEGLTLSNDPAVAARQRFRGVGLGYLRFARTEPGLFRTAFTIGRDDTATDSPDAAGPTGRSSIELLGDALDEMVATGSLPVARRPGAEYLAWSAVHGLAFLAIDGPLRTMPDDQLDAMGQRMLDMIDRGM
ncbi:TetR-like C-terminal domain-containing protein [Nocardia sp. NPDC051756]|uniref:TetR/AcrR family transcriptional regulator n=1 Tax=Nocardia sp. NPDC051756 TaxID=3154751 RepID=UPI00342B173D